MNQQFNSLFPACEALKLGRIGDVKMQMRHNYKTTLVGRGFKWLEPIGVIMNHDPASRTRTLECNL